MEKPEENLSTGELRKQLISAIKDFIKDLEHNSLENLVEKRMCIVETLELLQSRERKESAPLKWSKNPSVSARVIPLPSQKEGSNEEEEDDDDKTQVFEGA